MVALDDTIFFFAKTLHAHVRRNALRRSDDTGSHQITMQIIFLTLALLTPSWAQWTTSGNDIYNTNSGNVGIGTTTPAALFSIAGPVIAGSGTQFQWVASSGALRSGEVSGNQWGSANIGPYSVAFGFNCISSAPYASVLGGNSNQASSSYSIIGGGKSNSINPASDYGVITGGVNNTIQNATEFSAIAGGSQNSVTGSYGFVGGGSVNSAAGAAVVGGGDSNIASGNNSFVGGGGSNSAEGQYTTVAGGFGNQAVANDYESIGGGNANDINGGAYGTIAGGSSNKITAGSYATIPGGLQNKASGDYAFAAGLQARSQAQGAFVWADSQNSPLVSNTTDEFRIRAGGGFVFLSSPTLPTVVVSSGPIEFSTSSTAGSAVPNIFISSNTGGIGLGTAAPQTTLDVNGSAQFGEGASKSTFTAVAGGATFALQLSSGVTISNGGPIQLTAGGYIQWPDGSISTTAILSGSGSSSPSATIPWISSATVSASSCSALVPISSSATYSVYYNVTQTGAGIINSRPYWLVNNDNGSNYAYSSFSFDPDFGSQGAGAAQGSASAQIVTNSIGLDSQENLVGELTLWSWYGYPHQIHARGSWTLTSDSDNFNLTGMNSFRYKGAADGASIKLCTPTGNLSGIIIVTKLASY